MRGVGGAVLVVCLLAACSGSTKKSGATAGGGGGDATAGSTNGGSVAAAGSNAIEAGAPGNGGSGGSGGSGVGTAGTAGSAGEPTIQGTPGANHPDCEGDCGGSPVGEWVYTGATSCNLIPSSASPPEPQECTFLLLPNSTPGEPPVILAQGPRFDFSGQPLEHALLTLDPNGAYTFVTLYRGTGHMELSAQCRKLGENVVACSDVAAAVEPALLGEGAGRNLTCSDNAEGGCDCSYEVNLVGGSSGVWRTTPDGKLLLQPSYLLPDAPAAVPATYCVGETLALGPELRIPGQAATGEPMVFAPLDCADGAMGPGEEGVDCGLFCDPCP